MLWLLANGAKSVGGTARRPASRAMLSSMKDARERLIAGFTAGEREYIRRELDQFFSSLPSVAEGFQLRVWRGGQQAGHPKISPSAQRLLDRGLMRLDTTQKPPRLFFTKPGLGALREMMTDRRLADSVKFAHVQRELGIDPALDDKAAE
jgi:hypothetical protein